MMAHCSRCGKKIDYVYQVQKGAIQPQTPQVTLGIPTYVDPETRDREKRSNNGVLGIIIAVIGLIIVTTATAFIGAVTMLYGILNGIGIVFGIMVIKQDKKFGLACIIINCISVVAIAITIALTYTVFGGPEFF